MSKINTDYWKKFTLAQLFNIDTGGDLIYRDIIPGEYPVISHKKTENGINCWTQYIENRPLYNHNVTISLADRGCFSAKVQPMDFYIGTRVKALISKNLDVTTFHLKFLATCINMETFKYCYGRNATDKIDDIEIRLPVTKNDEIDWEYIENTIKSLSKNLKQTTNSQKSDNIRNHINNWRMFNINEYFDIIGSKTTKLKILNDDYGLGEYPYVTTQATNNGVAGYYDYYTESGNILVADSAVTGFVSYQPKNFSASDHVEKLVPKFNMNKHIAMFLVTILNYENYRYAYGRKFNQDNIRNTRIKLPAIQKDDGTYEPDWQYMEDYIKFLPYADLI